MDHEDARQRMREIQRIMERTTLYTLLPGKAAIIGGVLALLGCAVSYAMLRSVDFGVLLKRPLPLQAGFLAMWAFIAVAAVTQDVVITARAARRQNISPTARPGRFAAYALTPSVLVAAMLTVKIVLDTDAGAMQAQALRYLAPIWMMCYGTGVYAGGLFSVALPRRLGIGFILLGAAGLLGFERYGLILTALSFGLLHIAFGVVVIGRARQSEQT